MHTVDSNFINEGVCLAYCREWYIVYKNRNDLTKVMYYNFLQQLLDLKVWEPKT